VRSISVCGLSFLRRVAIPIEIVTRPRSSPAERFISSLVITARRMWSATAMVECSTVFGKMIANSSPP
jgi:hypothetical protein